ncbi:hypothetical protein IQ07DRAFT_646609 [Pyrenochaeta sp. DS3sAY3a]|nr:hypothetical protein IQ07DRAFT_646609 [Pyrenochaeta sp. DS3sAY3a]
MAKDHKVPRRTVLSGLQKMWYNSIFKKYIYGVKKNSITVIKVPASSNRRTKRAPPAPRPQKATPPPRKHAAEPPARATAPRVPVWDPVANEMMVKLDPDVFDHDSDSSNSSIKSIGQRAVFKAAQFCTKTANGAREATRKPPAKKRKRRRNSIDREFLASDDETSVDSDASYCDEGEDDEEDEEEDDEEGEASSSESDDSELGTENETVEVNFRLTHVHIT